MTVGGKPLLQKTVCAERLQCLCHAPSAKFLLHIQKSHAALSVNSDKADLPLTGKRAVHNPGPDSFPDVFLRVMCIMRRHIGSILFRKPADLLVPHRQKNLIRIQVLTAAAKEPAALFHKQLPDKILGDDHPPCSFRQHFGKPSCRLRFFRRQHTDRRRPVLHKQVSALVIQDFSFPSGKAFHDVDVVPLIL